ncbi:MAG: hypothetical protein ACTTK2_04650 [Hoylesella marshii]|uniref:Uncharacterized protein n=1 Tax=Hoylesella marshii DSM 16973 = JCM 13450 TaxID=862515 RepID=E0NUV0_9BACT|nr:hypothetical protein [Hoylesella marshii]EFM01105.1 hypothetical protein HMPREF0658_1955 [Hoylesella marshii DSM 16973 = JCM 13450]
MQHLWGIHHHASIACRGKQTAEQNRHTRSANDNRRNEIGNLYI